MKMVRAWRHNPRQVYGPGELIYRNQGAPKLPPAPENRQIVEVLGGLPPAPGVTLDATQVFWNPAADTVDWSWYFNGDLLEGESGVTCPADLPGDYVNVQRGTNADGTGSSSSAPFNIPEAPPAGNTTLTPGSSSTGAQFGYGVAGGPGAPGSITPTEWQDLTGLFVFHTAVSATPGRIDLQKVDQTQIEGTWASLRMDFAGYPGGPVIIPWSSGTARYRGIDTGLADWVAGQNEVELALTISDGALPAPLPAPVVTAGTTSRPRRKRRAKG